VAEFYVATPFPGSPLYERVKGRLLTNDLTRYDAFTPVFEHDNLSCEEIARLRETAFTSYYRRPTYLLKYLRRRMWR
jgi:anaerobic magnesium-protoporphyrin IX monomethyl ester cyclase